MAGIGKLTRGRQKIEMKIIEDSESRLVTFSKRRAGIYKKINEIVISCGAEVGIVVFSPTGKPFSYGCPSLEEITNRFLCRNLGPMEDDIILRGVFNAHNRMRMTVLSWAFGDLLTQMSEVKEEGDALKRVSRAIREGVPADQEPEWWEKSPADLGAEELKDYMAKLEAVHKEINDHLDKRDGKGTLGGPADPAAEPATSESPADEAGEGHADLP